MFGIIVSGHGHFASGISSALELILGKQEDYTYVDFPQNDGAYELELNMNEAIDKYKNQPIIIFCDLLSGSPFNIAIMRAMKENNIKVFYGTNLGMLVECVMQRNMGLPYEEVVSMAVEIGKTQVGMFEIKNYEKDEFDD